MVERCSKSSEDCVLAGGASENCVSDCSSSVLGVGSSSCVRSALSLGGRELASGGLGVGTLRVHCRDVGFAELGVGVGSERR